MISSIHTASRVDCSMHSPALLEMVKVPVSRPLIEYLIETVVETVDFAMGHASTSRGRSTTRSTHSATFAHFATNIITRAEVTTPVLLATLVYITRARAHLHITLEQWALERVFLGALVVAHKYLNDCALKNVHWSLCSGVFGKRDVGRVEREFLDVLAFELRVSEADLLEHFHPVMACAEERRVHFHASAEGQRRPRARAPTPVPAHRPAFTASPPGSEESDEMDLDSDSDSLSSSSPQTPPYAPYAPARSKAALPQTAGVHAVAHRASHAGALQHLMSFPGAPAHIPRFAAPTAVLA